MLWLLLIVMLPCSPVYPAAVRLNQFYTYEQCRVERDRIGFEMAEAYPWERDFVIECRERLHLTSSGPLSEGAAGVRSGDSGFPASLGAPGDARQSDEP